MFIIPPRNFVKEISHQLTRIGKHITRFPIANMPVIPFTGLVVVSQHTLAIDYISQAIFERMYAAGNGLWYMPNNDIGESGFRLNDTPPNQLSRFHEGNGNSVAVCWQLYQHSFSQNTHLTHSALRDYANLSPGGSHDHTTR
jgi:hypothetical protein